MDFTGERYVPQLRGQIYYEHVHRYAIAARLSAGKRVLDIASGEGYGAALLAHHAESVIGVDIDAETVEQARRRYYATNLRFLRGSVTEVPLGDATVDIVTSFETIEHVSEHDRMLDELRRVLVPGGVLVISSPNKLVYSDESQHENPFHLRELYFSELRDQLTKRFRHVAFYGQRIAASSLVHPLAGRISESPWWYNGGSATVTNGLPTLSSPAYFLAVCSDEPVVLDISSSYVDPGNDLLLDVFAELNGLRSALVLRAGEGQPALPPGNGAVHGSYESSPPQRELVQAGKAPPALVARLEAERDAAQARVAECIESIKTLEREVDGAQAQLRRAQGASLAAVTELAEERGRVNAIAQNLLELRAAQTASEQRAAAALEAAERRHAESEAALRAEVFALRTALDAAGRDSQALREILSSHSWRLTAPLRKAVKIVRR